MPINISAPLRRRFLLLSIVVVLLVLVVVAKILNPLFAIRGSYVLLGLVVTAIIYFSIDPSPGVLQVLDHSTNRGDHRESVWLGKGVMTAATSTVAAATILNSRLIPLLIGLSSGYLLVLLQLYRNPQPRWLLTQIVALFSVSPLTKYLATGFYIGNGDLVIHITSVEQLLDTGSIDQILGAYQVFPGYHLLVASTSLVTGIPAYDTTLIVGTIVFSSVGILVFALARMATRSSELAIYVALAATVLLPVPYFASNFIPGSLAAVFGLVFLFVAFRTGTSTSNQRAFVIASVVIVSALVITHHLTFVLYTIMLSSFFVVDWLVKHFNTGPKTQLRGSLGLPAATLLVAACSAIVYWTWIGKGFIFAFVPAVVSIAETITTLGIAQATTASQGAIMLGMTIPAPTMANALLWLATPVGIYYTLLVSIFGLGLLAVAESRIKGGLLSIVLTGAVGAVVQFKTPLVIGGLSDLRLVWTFLFAFVIGLGIVRVTRTEFGSLMKASSLVLVALLCVTGPIAAADDFSELRIDLPEQQSTQERVFSEQELRTLAATSGHIETYGSRVSTLWATSLMLDRFAASNSGKYTVTGANITESAVRTGGGLFLYRSSWDRHALIMSGYVYQRTIYVSDRWVKSIATTRNKVYTTGNAGLLWSEEPSMHSDENTTTTQKRR